ncbi:cytochrome c1 [Pseudomonadota bacterium]
MRKFILSTAVGLVLSMGGALPPAAQASDMVKPIDIKWSFEGIFGTFDRAAIKRGSQVFFEVCNGCHSMDLVAYRNLVEIGMDEQFVKDLAAEYEVADGPNDEGDMFTRPARLSDRVVSPFANEKAARFFNGGAYPPDLSVITKARANGPDYIYSLLVGYQDKAPEGFELAEGTSYNEYFPGHQIFMGRPIADGSVEYEDGTSSTLDQLAKDVVVFLAWAAEPELEERKSMGVWVLAYLIVLTILLYLLKRRIWGRICLDEFTHDPYTEMYQEELDKHSLSD